MGSMDKDNSGVEIIGLSPFNNKVNSNFDFQSEMKANAYPGERMNINEVIYSIRESINDAGLTGLFDLKRELVGKEAAKQQPSAYERNRSRSRGRWRKGKR